jgi:hypothetical protein
VKIDWVKLLVWLLILAFCILFWHTVFTLAVRWWGW